MKLARRRFLHLAAGAAALPAASRIARAQTYPTRPVRIIVGFAAGGASDIVARLMGQWLSDRLRPPFIRGARPRPAAQATHPSGASPARPELIGGQVRVMVGPVPASIELIRAGKRRPLGVPTTPRWEALPNIPTGGEFVPCYEASGWNGVGAPKNTPAEIVDKLNKEINAGLADPNIKARLADLGGTPLAGSPADFGKVVAHENEKWAKGVQFSRGRAE